MQISPPQVHLIPMIPLQARSLGALVFLNQLSLTGLMHRMTGKTQVLILIILVFLPAILMMIIPALKKQHSNGMRLMARILTAVLMMLDF